jgi:hypothetical protein
MPPSPCLSQSFASEDFYAKCDKSDSPTLAVTSHRHSHPRLALRGLAGVVVFDPDSIFTICWAPYSPIPLFPYSVTAKPW